MSTFIAKSFQIFGSAEFQNWYSVTREGAVGLAACILQVFQRIILDPQREEVILYGLRGPSDGRIDFGSRGGRKPRLRNECVGLGQRTVALEGNSR